MPHVLHRLFQLIAAVTVSLAFSSAALANPDAEKFAGGLVEQAMTILHDKTGSDPARAARLHTLVMQNLDARKTALFALGSYQRGLDHKTVDNYVAAFTDYITAVYEARLKKFRDLDIKVVNSIDNAPTDTTVITQGKPSADMRDKDSIIIGLRLTGGGGRYKIVDVQIAGIWVSIHEREEFAKMLSENNANLHALTSYLADQTAQIKAGAKQV
jgi:phospholipid transport system substrate-binding protein